MKAWTLWGSSWIASQTDPCEFVPWVPRCSKAPSQSTEDAEETFREVTEEKGRWEKRIWGLQSRRTLCSITKPPMRHWGGTNSSGQTFPTIAVGQTYSLLFLPPRTEQSVPSHQEPLCKFSFSCFLLTFPLLPYISGNTQENIHLQARVCSSGWLLYTFTSQLWWPFLWPPRRVSCGF